MPRGKRKQEADAEGSKAKRAKKIESEDDTKEGDGAANSSSSSAGLPACDKPFNFKVTSWNINGIRAWIKKNPVEYFKEESPDVICLQETKCDAGDLPKIDLPDYEFYWSSSVEKKGYAGTALFSKTKPLSVSYGIGIEKHDQEGRVITAEYQHCYVVTSYVPNSGRGLVRLDYRVKEWDLDFRDYLKTLDGKKPVILCGDLNVSHLDIDLANPKTNKKTAGFTKEERDSFSDLLKEGFFDSFRHLYPDKTGAYTFWSAMGNSRQKNVGWRLDYFVLSEALKSKLADSVIRDKVMGSDHCPVTLFLNL